MMEKTVISKVYARQIFDSRGMPTIEVEVTLSDGKVGTFGVPSGASTGSFEAIELRDNDNTKNGGKSVYTAVKNVNEIISAAVVGMDAYDQEGLDSKLISLDGTKNKAKLGANAILGVSVAACKAAAMSKNLPIHKYIAGEKKGTLPMPMMNVINGGKHADNSINIQEFMIAPISAKTFREGMDMCTNVFHKLKSILKKEGYATSVGDEGGFAPNFKNDEESLIFLNKAIVEAGYKLGSDFKIALDVAAGEMKNEAIKIGEEDKYYFWKTKELFTASELNDYYKRLSEKYHIYSIEDGLGEDDWENWKGHTDYLKDNLQLVGDDLFVTNIERLSKGIELGVANSILIKLNQIGTVTETVKAVNMAKENNMTTIISHRSGETVDTFISDLAVGLSAGQMKSGAPSRGERVEKYNRLLRIEEELEN